MPSRRPMRWLIEHELRELAASRSYWMMLIVIGALVGHALIDSVDIYREASGAAGGPAALSQGLSPLEGIVVPVLGSYDLAATLLFPFVVIRLIAVERQTGSLALMLQAPVSFTRVIAAKSLTVRSPQQAAIASSAAATPMMPTNGSNCARWRPGIRMPSIPPPLRSNCSCTE